MRWEVYNGYNWLGWAVRRAGTVQQCGLNEGTNRINNEKALLGHI